MARQAKLTADLTANTSRFEAGMNNASKSLNRFGQNVQRTSQRSSASMMALNNSSSALAGSFGALAGAFTAINIVRIADQMNLLTARIKQSTQTTEEFRRAFSGLSNIAVETGGSLAASVDVFQRLSFSRKEINTTVDDMVQFTEIVQKLGVVSGASTTALQAGLLQLGQGLSAGVLRAEEFNSIIENIPAVANAIAKEFGVSTGQLRQLVLDGKVLSKDVFQAILNQSSEVRQQFEALPVTVQRATAQLRNQFELLVQTATGLSGSQELLVEGLELATRIVKNIESDILLLQLAFIDVGGAAKQAFNDALVAAQNFFNKTKVLLSDLSGGAIKPELSTDVFAIDYEGQAQARIDEIIAARENIAKELEKPITSNAGKPLSQDYSKMAGDIAIKSSTPKKATKDASDYIRQLQLESMELEIQTSMYGKKGSAIDRASRQLKLNNQLTQAGISLSKEQQKQVDKYLDKIEQQTDLQEMQAKQQRELEDRERSRRQALDNLAASFEGAFEDAIVSGQKLSDVLGGLAQDIIRLSIRRSIVTPLVNSIFDGSGGGLGGMFSSLLGGSFATGIDYVPRDMLAMVHKGESIIPRQQADNMRGGGDVVVNVINNTPSKVSTQSQDNGNGGMDFTVMIDQAVADNISRQGSRTNQALNAVSNRALVRR